MDETKESVLNSYCNEEIPTDRIIGALSSIERSKEAWGLADIDFENIYIGTPVYTYVYSDGSFTENSKIYPISNDNQLILLAVDSDGMITITTELVDTLNNVVDFDDSFAIIYDSYGCYICTNDSRVQVAEYHIDNELEIPSVLPKDNEEFSENITYTKLIDKYYLPYVPPYTLYADDYEYSCDVPKVDQLPDNLICWAASVACVINYKKGTHLTAQKIAKDYFGVDYNRPAGLIDDTIILNSYGITYISKIFYPTDYQIFNNLRLGYPLISRWINDGPINKRSSSDDINHECVIFGIDTYSGYISIMDPWGGEYYLAEYDGHDYWYNSLGIGNSYHLGAAILHKA